MRRSRGNQHAPGRVRGFVRAEASHRSRRRPPASSKARRRRSKTRAARSPARAEFVRRAGAEATREGGSNGGRARWRPTNDLKKMKPVTPPRGRVFEPRPPYSTNTRVWELVKRPRRCLYPKRRFT
eukprot:29338-Pelagococcus_subviridis.AAC.2